MQNSAIYKHNIDINQRSLGMLLQRVWLLEGYNNYAFHWTGVAVAIF